MNILDEVKKEFIRDLAKSGKRADERGPDEYRKISLEHGLITTAEGSAQVKMGKTQVLAGVKLATGTPFPDRPKEGVFSTNAEFLPLASPTFESGPPSEESIELARVVDRGIRSSNAVDVASLFIGEAPDGKPVVWSVYLDLYILDHDGNLIDAAALAAMAAIRTAQMPKYEDGKVIREATKNRVPSKNDAVECTFAKIGDRIYLDPSYDEEVGMDCRFTAATTPGHICACQKGGRGAFTTKELDYCMDLALRKGDELRRLLPE
ncbi:MAG: exosome complex protein Rrp42 [Candidatus Micrarchaeia archaeon]|jgi:exosome complex component RRP42